MDRVTCLFNLIAIKVDWNFIKLQRVFEKVILKLICKKDAINKTRCNKK